MVQGWVACTDASDQRSTHGCVTRETPRTVEQQGQAASQAKHYQLQDVDIQASHEDMLVIRRRHRGGQGQGT
jgi:hypothetical protein